ncbi:hypothetical protein [Chitinibacter tainanensis]|uniref:hypothetical protein n=1 Tax=Chitinibacter tainanensis TaxID=230667 RepID=UPI0012EB2072|nr:hypothetical protein [Chitinibacter tainanensis]
MRLSIKAFFKRLFRRKADLPIATQPPKRATTPRPSQPAVATTRALVDSDAEHKALLEILDRPTPRPTVSSRSTSFGFAQTKPDTDEPAVTFTAIAAAIDLLDKTDALDRSSERETTDRHVLSGLSPSPTVASSAWSSSSAHDEPTRSAGGVEYSFGDSSTSYTID